MGSVSSLSSLWTHRLLVASSSHACVASRRSRCKLGRRVAADVMAWWTTLRHRCWTEETSLRPSSPWELEHAHAGDQQASLQQPAQHMEGELVDAGMRSSGGRSAREDNKEETDPVETMLARGCGRNDASAVSCNGPMRRRRWDETHVATSRTHVATSWSSNHVQFQTILSPPPFVRFFVVPSCCRRVLRLSISRCRNLHQLRKRASRGFAALSW